MAKSAGAQLDLASFPKNFPEGHHLRYVGDVAIMVLNDFENRLNLDSIRAMEKCMDEAERLD